MVEAGKGHTAKAAAALAGHSLLVEPRAVPLLESVARDVLALGRTARGAAPAELHCLAFLGPAVASPAAAKLRVRPAPCTLPWQR